MNKSMSSTTYSSKIGGKDDVASRLEAINEQIRLVKLKQAKLGLDKPKHSLPKIKAPPKKKDELYHPNLDLVLAEMAHSPYLTSPMERYPKTLNMPVTLKEYRFEKNKSKAPCDLDKAKEVWRKEIHEYGRIIIEPRKKDLEPIGIETHDEIPPEESSPKKKKKKRKKKKKVLVNESPNPETEEHSVTSTDNKQKQLAEVPTEVPQIENQQTISDAAIKMQIEVGDRPGTSTPAERPMTTGAGKRMTGDSAEGAEGSTVSARLEEELTEDYAEDFFEEAVSLDVPGQNRAFGDVPPDVANGTETPSSVTEEVVEEEEEYIDESES
jgi:hypothetical protein